MGFIDKLGDKVGDKLGNVFGGAGDMFEEVLLDPNALAGDDGGASIKAAEIAASGQREQLEYLKEINALPQEYREQALAELAGVYSGDDPSQQQAMIDRAKASPLYKEIMGGKEAGEEAALRHATQTGGFRSGNVQSAMYGYNEQLQNRALAETYGQQMAGLKGLAGLSTNESEIGGVMGGIGETLASGQISGANAQAQQRQNNTQLGLGIASLFI